ncbi:MAG TPA: hypothetical protein VL974_12430, partial [Magnetospirillum sp.]|nr:hypothetical protein [Magnetospirillum sp.]
MARNRRRIKAAPAKPAAPARPMGFGPRFSTLRKALLACSSICTVLALPAGPAHALPQGGQITQGSG